MKNPSTWPIAHLHKEDHKFIKSVEDHTMNKLMTYLKDEESLKLTLVNTINKEKIRIRRKKYKIDPKDDLIFWTGLEKKINRDDNISKSNLEEIYRKIIRRYANEINCKFNPKIAKISIIALAHALARILNPFKLSGITDYFNRVLDRIVFVGYKEKVKKLSSIGTLIIIPTHYSHFDSLYAGTLTLSLGIPIPLYGAGLNLFNYDFFAYFMRRIGTYTIDRRKKNLHYIETLKSYSELSIKYGCNTTFYPRGGRCRDGSVESKLKLGLLSTVFEAQQLAYKEDGFKARKIFIIPISLSSECVMEAPELINEYLREYNTSKIKKDSLWNKVRGFFRILQGSSYGAIGVGNPLDVYGNYVNEKGESLDEKGNIIDIYNTPIDDNLSIEVTNKPQNFILKLEKKIIEQYRRNNYIFLGHLSAFVLFQYLQKKYSNLEPKEFWNLPSEKTEISYKIFVDLLTKMKKIVLSKKDKFYLDSNIENLEDNIVLEGAINRLGSYHNKQPLVKTTSGNIKTEDIKVLFYYQNKLSGYGLEKYIWE